VHPIDFVVLALYFLGILGIGVYFMRRNRNSEDYYVGGRGMTAGHVGLSVVATDVGGGFSIGLGGLGFTMGIAGSWLLFTGLIGAWLAAVLLIPRVFEIGRSKKLFTYPQLFGTVYTKRVAIAAALVSALGYAGFTASQLKAGAKLAGSTLPVLDEQSALWAMGVLAVLYTSIGGMKAVIYTDTFQWALLMVGLILIGIPIAVVELGGVGAVLEALPDEFYSLTNVGPVTLVNWAFSIIPIWFVGMTLYQRIYSCGDAPTAKRAWYFAGLLEYPVMAFLGTTLGVLGRIAWQQDHFAAFGFPASMDIDPEKGLPLLLGSMLPVGLTGLMLAAYFSAVLSTADSCLMASSGNMTTDLFPSREGPDGKGELLRNQVFTLGIGVVALILASTTESVLDLMLYSYGFMVSGLLVPTVALLVKRRPSSSAAFAAILVGGFTTVGLSVLADEQLVGRIAGWFRGLVGAEGEFAYEPLALPLGLDANIFGISAALVAFVGVSALSARRD
jgi:SSS family solute:Na+ symporter